MTEESFPVALGGRQWSLPHLPFRAIKKIQPALFQLYAELGGAAISPASVAQLSEAQLDRLAVGVLDQGRLAARLIDGKDGDIIFAPRKRFGAVQIHQVRGAVGQVDEFAAGMDVNRAGGLAHNRPFGDGTPLPKRYRGMLLDIWTRARNNGALGQSASPQTLMP